MTLLEQAYRMALKLNAMSAPLVYDVGKRTLVIVAKEIRRNPPLTWWVSVEEGPRLLVNCEAITEIELRRTLKHAIQRLQSED